MQKIIGLFETLTLYILSYIVPKSDDLILFGSMKGRYIGGNPKIFYLYLNQFHNGKYKLLFFDGNYTNKDERIKTYGFGFKKYILILRARYLIIDACSFDLGIKGVISGNFNLIQMWHGEPIKRIGLLSEEYISRRNKIVLFFEKLEYKTYKIVLSNPQTKEIIQGTFGNSNVLNIGVPRNDVILSNEILSINENRIVKEFLADSKKTFDSIMLFAPTFRETNMSRYFSPFELDTLNEQLKKNNYLLLIKKHINEQREFLGGIDYSNIIDVTFDLNYDSTDFLPFIDTLMTDYSSIYIDFLLIGKPIIFYQNDLNDYINKERGLFYSPEEVIIKETTAYNVTGLVSILDNLESIITSDKYSESYGRLYDLFYKELDRTTTSCETLYNLVFKK